MSLLKNIVLLLPCTVIGCNTQIAVTGEARERLLYPIPYGARWVKEGMSRESRLADWVACGGGSDLRDGFRTSRYQEPMREYFKELETHTRSLASCMYGKEYSHRSIALPNQPDQCDSRCLYP
jgi:hypothetical protein